MSNDPADMADMALSLGLVKTREEFERAVEDAVRRFSDGGVQCVLLADRERELGIVPSDGQGLADRRATVLARMEISAGYEEKPVDEDTQREAAAIEQRFLARRWSPEAARDNALALVRFRRSKLADEDP